jgi:MarR family transcriptional regulator, organic hydroperoxide resistance regulator
MSLAQHWLRKSADSSFKEALGISMTQLGVLFILEKNSGTTLKDLSEELGVNASAITALVDRMEEAGLVQCKPSNDEERAQLLFATSEGLRRAVAARAILARLNAPSRARF